MREEKKNKETKKNNQNDHAVFKQAKPDEFKRNTFPSTKLSMS